MIGSCGQVILNGYLIGSSVMQMDLQEYALERNVLNDNVGALHEVFSNRIFLEEQEAGAIV